jgi:hypothetical protein
MSVISNCSPIEVRNLIDRIESELKNCARLQEASQECARLLYEEFEESIVLARVFMTLPFRVLTSRDKSFVTELAGTRNLQHLLNDKTQILSLLGTYGEQSEWRDRFQSRGHIGIPLLSASFVESIPMVSRLMNDMGISTDWFDETEQDVLVKSLGRAAGVFYVRDARTWLDHQNRKIVSAQDFVEEYGVKTVFGLGGSYLNGSFVTIIVFTRETIEQARAEAFISMVNTFKVATMRHAMAGLIFP